MLTDEAHLCCHIHLVGHAGAVLLRRCADKVGLTGALAAVLPVGVGRGWRDRATLVVQLAVAIVLGATKMKTSSRCHLSQGRGRRRRRPLA
ncbi:hypothetical protein [Streptomyces sp. NBC_00842]|uniref:hypothetical protein n=1 Tax=Streptomyces sp. NBC_00842 TaxID=2975848 RepID=UPI0038664ED5|nr:transposase [Streptomyces sp. NBC_00842]